MLPFGRAAVISENVWMETDDPVLQLRFSVAHKRPTPVRNSSRSVLLGYRPASVVNSLRALVSENDRSSGLCRMAVLIISLALGACASQTVAQRDNVDLRDTIHESVPDSWRAAADSAQEISPLTVTPDLRKFILSTGRTNAADRERMISLAEAIVDRDGIGLVYDPEATHTASEAFRSGTGNCLGFSNLLVASARELGLDAQFELVLQQLRWNKVEDVLVGSLHVRVVSLVGGNRMVLDFYPLPVESGYATQPLSDDDALAHHLNNLAAESMQDGDSALAYARLHKAIEASPNVAFVWSNLGILLSRHDLDLLAEAALKEALSISPDALSALSNLQRLYFAQGRNAEAGELTDQLEQYRARNPYYHSWLGDQAYEQGNYEEAVRRFKRAIKLKKNERAFYIALSDSYAQLGNTKAALRASRRAQTMREPRVTSYSVGYKPPKTGTRISQ